MDGAVQNIWVLEPPNRLEIFKAKNAWLSGWEKIEHFTWASGQIWLMPQQGLLSHGNKKAPSWIQI